LVGVGVGWGPGPALRSGPAWGWGWGWGWMGWCGRGRRLGSVGISFVRAGDFAHLVKVVRDTFCAASQGWSASGVGRQVRV